MAIDYASGNNGSMNGGLDASVDSVDGLIGNALSFAGEGSDEFIDLGSSPELLPDTFTVTAWMKFTNSTPDHDTTIFGWDGSSGFPALKANSFGDRAIILMNPNNYRYYETPAITDGWHHIAFTMPGAAQSDILNSAVFIDGVSAPPSTSSSSSAQTAKQAAIIASRSNSAGNGYEEFEGDLDDVRIYNRVLTDEEIAQCCAGSSSTIVTDGLVGHWKLDETSGTDVIDYASSNNGTMQGGLDASSDSVQGRVGKALDFDGLGSINLGDPVGGVLDFGTTQDFSIAAWVKVPTGSGGGFIFSKAGGGTGGDWWMGINSAAGTPDVNLDDRVGSGAAREVHVIGTSLDLRDGQWHHLVGVYDRDGLLQLYMDGELIDSGDISGATDTLDNAHDAHIGNSDIGGNIFEGAIDDVRVYGRVLTAAEISQLYAAQEGRLRYNTSYRVPEYFNGDQWVATAIPKPTSKGLVGHWKLDEESGTFADSSGYGNDGTQSGGVEYASSGVIADAAGFDGIDDYIDAGEDDTTFWISEVTFSLWIKPSTLAGQKYILTYAPTNCWASSFSLATKSNNELEIWFGTGSANYGTASYDLQPDTWYHVVGQFSDVDDSAKLYINGALEVDGTETNAIGSGSTETLYIGGCGTEFFDGVIDDVRIYNRALSDAEIGDLYASGNGYNVRSVLVGWWRLDETSGSVVSDGAGNNHGTWTDGVDNDVTGETVAAKAATGIDFDGFDDRVSVPSFDVNGAGLTLAAWIYPHSTNPGNNDPRIIMKTDNVASGTTQDWGLFIDDPGTGNMTFRLKTIGTTQTVNLNYAPILNEWQHVLITYDAQTAAMTFYVDGEETFSGTHTDGGPVATGTGRPVGIGNVAAGAGNREFDGPLDDVRVYNRPLDADEVRQLYFWGLANGPACSGPANEEGSIIYNTTHSVMQYCDGNDWRRIGR